MHKEGALAKASLFLELPNVFVPFHRIQHVDRHPPTGLGSHPARHSRDHLGGALGLHVAEVGRAAQYVGEGAAAILGYFADFREVAQHIPHRSRMDTNQLDVTDRLRNSLCSPLNPQSHLREPIAQLEIVENNIA